MSDKDHIRVLENIIIKLFRMMYQTEEEFQAAVRAVCEKYRAPSEHNPPSTGAGNASEKRNRKD